MSAIVLKNKNFLSYFNNIGSRSLGFYFSFLLHFFLLIISLGMPSFFDREPISLPNIIPIEIINVTETTSIPKKINETKPEDKVNKNLLENKKFNNSENQQIKKIDLKEKPEIKKTDNEVLNTPKDDIIIKEKIKTPIKLEKEKKVVTLEKSESLPTKIIKPKIKPQLNEKTVTKEKKSDLAIKIQPKTKPPPEFSIASMLKDLRNERTTQRNKENEDKPKSENISNEEESKDDENMLLSISEIDFLIQQLSSCWSAPAGAVIEKGMVVKIAAKIKPDRRVQANSVRIIDTNVSKSNPFYGPITESAMRTLLNPECIPLNLPENKYDLWKNLTITFDHSIMKGY